MKRMIRKRKINAVMSIVIGFILILIGIIMLIVNLIKGRGMFESTFLLVLGMVVLVIGYFVNKRVNLMISEYERLKELENKNHYKQV